MHLPFELHGGAAYIGKRGEIEVSVLGYSSISPYAMLSNRRAFRLSVTTGIRALLKLSR